MTHDLKKPFHAHDQGKRISRREFLRAAGVVTLGLAAAGCRADVPEITADAPTAGALQTVIPTVGKPAEAAAPGIPSQAVEAPVGVARGIYPGRVVWAHNPQAAHWDGQSGFWWQDEATPPPEVAAMLSRALQVQAGESEEIAAWEALFRSFNSRRGRGAAGYQAGEKIAIKINLNQVGRHSYQENGAFTTPQLVEALLRQLVEKAGVPASAITVFDAIRFIPDAIFTRCKVPALEGVHFVDWSGGSGREKYARDPDVLLHWSGDVKGNPTGLPTCVTGAEYLINLAQLRGHNLAGVTLCAKNHFGTILADLDGRPTQQAPQGAGIHGTVAAHDFGWGDPAWTWKQRPKGTYNALVDLMGHPHLGDKTLLFILDGLYVPDHQEAKVEAKNRWQSAPFNDHWTASLLLSQDGVAIDSVGADFLLAEPTLRSLQSVLPAHTTCDNYLHEAAQAGEPPSGTVYDPAGDGSGLDSLGVHEHWNDAEVKAYSRNLGTGEGIELVRVT